MRPIFLVGALALAVPALAHHGFTGRYDNTAPLYLEGQVTAATWGFPHAVLEIALTDGGAVPPALAEEFGAGLSALTEGTTVTVELPPVRLFNALEDRIVSGDRIALVVLRNCDPPHQLRAQWVAPASGDPVLRASTLQDEVAGC